MDFNQKIITVQEFKKRLISLRRQGRSIAFTNGCFDLMHKGHVTYLQQAKKDSRVLIVGLNSDQSIRSIKGPFRPIVDEKSRAAVLAALESVDFVVIFNEDTPYQLIASVQPDVLIKGADWKGKEVVGSDIVRARGGKVRLINYVPNRSSTNIIGMVLTKCRK